MKSDDRRQMLLVEFKRGNGKKQIAKWKDMKPYVCKAMFIGADDGEHRCSFVGWDGFSRVHRHFCSRHDVLQSDKSQGSLDGLK